MTLSSSLVHYMAGRMLALVACSRHTEAYTLPALYERVDEVAVGRYGREFERQQRAAQQQQQQTQARPNYFLALPLAQHTAACELIDEVQYGRAMTPRLPHAPCSPSCSSDHAGGHAHYLS